jgi:hypothetical protein
MYEIQYLKIILKNLIEGNFITWFWFGTLMWAKYEISNSGEQIVSEIHMPGIRKGIQGWNYKFESYLNIGCS